LFPPPGACLPPGCQAGNGGAVGAYDRDAHAKEDSDLGKKARRDTTKRAFSSPRLAKIEARLPGEKSRWRAGHSDASAFLQLPSAGFPQPHHRISQRKMISQGRRESGEPIHNAGLPLPARPTTFPRLEGFVFVSGSALLLWSIRHSASGQLQQRRLLPRCKSREPNQNRKDKPCPGRSCELGRFRPVCSGFWDGYLPGQDGMAHWNSAQAAPSRCFGIHSRKKSTYVVNYCCIGGPMSHA